MTETSRPAPLDVGRIADLLEALPAIVDAELAALGPELATWRPAPGEWCANEVLGHFIEAERRGFTGRIRAMLAADRPTLEPWDQPAVAAARRDFERRPDELLGELAALRRESVALVRALGADDLGRTGVHPVVGELSVGDLLGEWVHHDRNHARQLLAIGQARVWDQMGNARRFVDPTA